jgi:hypothetical protein
MLEAPHLDCVLLLIAVGWTHREWAMLQEQRRNNIVGCED